MQRPSLHTLSGGAQGPCLRFPQKKALYGAILEQINSIKNKPYAAAKLLAMLGRALRPCEKGPGLWHYSALGARGTGSLLYLREAAGDGTEARPPGKQAGSLLMPPPVN